MTEEKYKAIRGLVTTMSNFEIMGVWDEKSYRKYLGLCTLLTAYWIAKIEGIHE